MQSLDTHPFIIESWEWPSPHVVSVTVLSGSQAAAHLATAPSMSPGNTPTAVSKLPSAPPAAAPAKPTAPAAQPMLVGSSAQDDPGAHQVAPLASHAAAQAGDLPVSAQDLFTLPAEFVRSHLAGVAFPAKFIVQVVRNNVASSHLCTLQQQPGTGTVVVNGLSNELQSDKGASLQWHRVAAQMLRLVMVCKEFPAVARVADVVPGDNEVSTLQLSHRLCHNSDHTQQSIDIPSSIENQHQPGLQPQQQQKNNESQQPQEHQQQQQQDADSEEQPQLQRQQQHQAPEQQRNPQQQSHLDPVQPHCIGTDNPGPSAIRPAWLSAIELLQEQQRQLVACLHNQASSKPVQPEAVLQPPWGRPIGDTERLVTLGIHLGNTERTVQALSLGPHVITHPSSSSGLLSNLTPTRTESAQPAVSTYTAVCSTAGAPQVRVTIQPTPNARKLVSPPDRQLFIKTSTGTAIQLSYSEMRWLLRWATTDRHRQHFPVSILLDVQVVVGGMPVMVGPCKGRVMFDAHTALFWVEGLGRCANPYGTLHHVHWKGSHWNAQV